MTNKEEILKNALYGTSKEYKTWLEEQEKKMRDDPNNTQLTEEYMAAIELYGSRTLTSGRYKRTIDKQRRDDRMQERKLQLENRIAHKNTIEMPCTEGETDMARHRVRVTLPDGEVVNFTGATEADMVKNAIARVSGNTAFTRSDIPTVDGYAEKWYNLVWKPKETAPNNT